MNTTLSPGIEAAVAAVFVEIYQPVAEVLGLQIENALFAGKAETDRLTVHVCTVGEEPAVRIPGGYMAEQFEVSLSLNYSAADHNEAWLNSVIAAIEARRNEIASLALVSTAPFAYLEILENGGQPFSFDNDRTLKQFVGTVCAALK